MSEKTEVTEALASLINKMEKEFQLRIGQLENTVDDFKRRIFDPFTEHGYSYTYGSGMIDKIITNIKYIIPYESFKTGFAYICDVPATHDHPRTLNWRWRPKEFGEPESTDDMVWKSWEAPDDQ